MSEIKIPTNADEAVAMALIGMSWLENNAPERLTELHREIKAEAGRDGFVAGYEFCLSTLPSPYRNLMAVNYKGMAERHADSIRQGEVK